MDRGPSLWNKWSHDVSLNSKDDDIVLLRSVVTLVSNTVRNGHGNFDLIMGNLPRTGCAIVSKAWEKKFCKCMGILSLMPRKYYHM
jgi:hypothetical protein